MFDHPLLIVYSKHNEKWTVMSEQDLDISHEKWGPLSEDLVNVLHQFEDLPYSLRTKDFRSTNQCFMSVCGLAIHFASWGL